MKKNFVLATLLCASVSLYALSASAETIYKYDAKGNLIEENYGNYKSEYTYDANGNQTARLDYSCSGGTCNNTPSSKYEYTYDSNGNQISDLYYDNADAIANNTPTGKDEYTYDANGNQISALYYNSEYAIANNTPSQKWEYTYDANGNKTSQLSYNNSTAVANNTPSQKWEYTYDANGNQISYSWYSSSDMNTPGGKQEYDYDEHGNMVGIKYYNSAAVQANTPNSQQSWENTYDTNGNLIEGKGLACGGGCLKTIAYEYDDYGNKIKFYEGGTLNASYIYDPAFLYNQWLANRKLRYTMQEADELTTNDNNNWVEWTFE